MAFITLRELVKRKLFQEGKTIHNYAQYMSYAAKSFKELEYFAIGNMIPTSVILDIEETTKTVRLPVDFVDWTVIGIKRGQGVINLGSNNNMLLNMDFTACGIPIGVVGESYYDQPFIADGNYYTYSGYWNDSPFELFGYGGGYSIGYFRLDLANWQIILNSEIMNVAEHIVLEYTGRIAKESSYVHPYCEKAILAGIDYYAKSNRRNTPQGMLAEAKYQWQVDIDRANAQMKAFDIHDWIKRQRRHFDRGVKI